MEKNLKDLVLNARVVRKETIESAEVHGDDVPIEPEKTEEKKEETEEKLA